MDGVLLAQLCWGTSLGCEWAWGASLGVPGSTRKHGEAGGS